MSDDATVVIYKDDGIEALKELYPKKMRIRYLLREYSQKSTKVAKDKILPVLCEYYASVNAYILLMKGFLLSEDYTIHDNKKAVRVTDDEVSAIKALQAIVLLCEEALISQHNLSTVLH